MIEGLGANQIISELAVSYAERNDFRAIRSMLSGGQIDMDTLISNVWVKLGGGKLSALASTFHKEMTKDQREHVYKLLTNIDAVKAFNSQIEYAQDLDALLNQFRELIINELGEDYNADLIKTSEVLKSAILKIKVNSEHLAAFQGAFLSSFEINVLIPIKAWLQGRGANEVVADKILARIAEAVVPSVIAGLKQNHPDEQSIERYFDEPSSIVAALVQFYINANDFIAIEKMIAIKQTDMLSVLDIAAGMGNNKLIAVASTFYTKLSKDELRGVFKHLGENLDSVKDFKNAVRNNQEITGILTDFKNAIVRDLVREGYNADLLNTIKLLKNSIARMHLESQDVELLKGKYLYIYDTYVTIPIKAWLQGREFDEIAAETIAARIANAVVPESIAVFEEKMSNEQIMQEQKVEIVVQQVKKEDQELFNELGGDDDTAQFMNKYLGTNLQPDKERAEPNKPSTFSEIVKKQKSNKKEEKDQDLEDFMNKWDIGDDDIGHSR